MIGHAAFLVVSLGLILYLAYVLIRPERF